MQRQSTTQKIRQRVPQPNFQNGLAVFVYLVFIYIILRILMYLVWQKINALSLDANCHDETKTELNERPMAFFRYADRVDFKVQACRIHAEYLHSCPRNLSDPNFLHKCLRRHALAKKCLQVLCSLSLSDVSKNQLLNIALFGKHKQMEEI